MRASLAAASRFTSCARSASKTANCASLRAICSATSAASRLIRSITGRICLVIAARCAASSSAMKTLPSSNALTKYSLASCRSSASRCSRAASLRSAAANSSANECSIARHQSRELFSTSMRRCDSTSCVLTNTAATKGAKWRRKEL